MGGRMLGGAVATVATVAVLAFDVATAGGIPAEARTPGVSVVSTVGGSSCTMQKLISSWSLRRLARETVVVPVAETNIGAVAPEVAAGAGGVILFGNWAPADLGDDLTALKQEAPGGIGPLVMTDEEGGKVQRMANLVGWIPSARRMAATMSPTEVRRMARRVGDRMRAAGVTMDLAPVLDLDDGDGPSATNPDGTRSFSLDPAVTATYGLAFARGMRNAGVVPVVKHFPGLGGASTNPDFGAAWTRPWRELEQRGLRPFAAAVQAGLPAVMVTTARMPGLTSLPATLSRAAIHGALRTRLGFHGLVLTDSLSASAISEAGFTVPRAAVRALRAGADLVLFNAAPADVAAMTDRVVHAIVAAVRSGELSQARLRQAAVHVLRAMNATVCR